MASIHNLHGKPSNAPAGANPANQLVGALEQMASSLITQQLTSMFESADDVLFEMANKARPGNDKQVFLDTMRTVRRERPRILRAFQGALHNALRRGETETAPSDVNLDDLESWTMQESSDLEEKIAVSNLDARAESLYSKELGELEQRLLRLSEDSKGAVSAKALSPARILDAFRTSMKGLEVEFPIKLVIYKLFDRVVVSNLGQVFTGANQMLADNGVQPMTTKPAAKKDKPAANAVTSEHLLSAFQQYLQGGGTPPNIGNIAGAVGAAGPAVPGTTAHQNAQLADEMLSVIESTSRGRPVSSWIPAQNLSLVGRMFDDLYADPQLPDATRPLLSRLQFPVMKLALSDPTFFTNQNHPVRSLVHDVHQTLTSVRGSSSADFKRLEELIQDLLQKFEPDPAKLRAKAREAAPVSEMEADKFLAQQKLRLEQQRRAFEEKVRRLCAQEMRLHIGDRRIPKPVLPLVLSGFGPMLVADYHAGGTEHADWKDTLALFDRLLESLDEAAANVAGRAVNEEKLAKDIVERMRDSGFAQAKIEQLTKPLAAVFEELGAAAPEEAAASMAIPHVPAPPTAEAEKARAVQRLLRGGDWFKVWIAENKNCRWLKLVSHYGGADTVVFEDFGADNCLRMSAKAFLADLAGGRSEPVDPDPAAVALLPLLGPGDPAFEQRAAWTKPQSSLTPD